MNIDTISQSPLLTVEEALTALGGVVPRSTFYRHLQTGEIPCFRLGGRRYVPSSWVAQVLALGQP